MFASFTTAELGMLRSKLYSAGHQFAEVARYLGDEALHLPPLSTEHDAVWDRRRHFTAAMHEVYELAEDTEAVR